MTNPAKNIIDWDGGDDSKLLQTFHALPPGRYELTLVEDEDLGLTDEQLEGLNHALDQVDRGEVVDGRAVFERLRKKLAGEPL